MVGHTLLMALADELKPMFQYPALTFGNALLADGFLKIDNY